MLPAPFDSARAAAALTPLAKLADLPDDKVLAALQRVPPARLDEALERLQHAADGPLEPALGRQVEVQPVPQAVGGCLQLVAL